MVRALQGKKVHQELKIPREDFIRLVTWVDSGGVYYGSYWGRRHKRYRDHPFFRPVPTFEEAISTRCPSFSTSEASSVTSSPVCS